MGSLIIGSALTEPQQGPYEAFSAGDVTGGNDIAAK